MFIHLSLLCFKYDTVRTAPFHPKIHNMGNVGWGGDLHARMAAFATGIIDKAAYGGTKLSTFQASGGVVLFLGTNQDAVTSAEVLGIPMSNALTFSNNGTSARVAFRSASANTERLRNGDFTGFSQMERMESIS